LYVTSVPVISRAVSDLCRSIVAMCRSIIGHVVVVSVSVQDGTEAAACVIVLSYVVVSWPCVVVSLAMFL